MSRPLYHHGSRLRSLAGCSVERIYVHQSVHDQFVSAFVEKAKQQIVGDPLDMNTTLGPVISLQSAARIRKQVDDAGGFLGLQRSGSDAQSRQERSWCLPRNNSPAQRLARPAWVPSCSRMSTMVRP